MARRIRFAGCLNFRDLGGYPAVGGRRVRWRRLFRSDSLHRMSHDDVARLLGELGIVTVVDLRTTLEREQSAPVAAEGRAGVRALHLPMIDRLFAEQSDAQPAPRTTDLGEAYAAMLDAGGPQVAAVLGALAEPDALPAVFYCAAGKDRTGVLAAVVLGLLGVGDGDIVADYALTDPMASEILTRAADEVPQYEEVWRSLPAEARRAPASVMTSMLEAVRRRHGDVAGYATAIGVDRDLVERLRQALLE
jgi:protein-tyrosine phosphatase